MPFIFAHPDRSGVRGRQRGDKNESLNDPDRGRAKMKFTR